MLRCATPLVLCALLVGELFVVSSFGGSASYLLEEFYGGLTDETFAGLPRPEAWWSGPWFGFPPFGVASFGFYLVELKKGTINIPDP